MRGIKIPLHDFALKKYAGGGGGSYARGGGGGGGRICVTLRYISSEECTRPKIGRAQRSFIIENRTCALCSVINVKCTDICGVF